MSLISFTFFCASSCIGGSAIFYVFTKSLLTVPGVIGTLQALEAIKIASGVGEPLTGRMLIFDALSGRIRVV